LERREGISENEPVEDQEGSRSMTTETNGILAYGSLLENPGPEIEKATVEVIRNVKTPIKDEISRTSLKGPTRAPTLVPVEIGGAQVNASIFLVSVSLREAKNRLYRRERNKFDRGFDYAEPSKIGPDTVVIKTIANLGGVGSVLYTDIGANIEPLTAERLAELAIESARQRNDRRDGITYLIDAMKHGIQTALSEAYATEILRQTGAANLEEALAKVRAEIKMPAKAS
jgi:hypothetical protein